MYARHSPIREQQEVQKILVSHGFQLGGLLLLLAVAVAAMLRSVLLAKRLVAAGFKLHQSTIARMEVGDRPTPVDEVAALAEIFRLPIAAMFDPPGTFDYYELLGRLKQKMSAITPVTTASITFPTSLQASRP